MSSPCYGNSGFLYQEPRSSHNESCQDFFIISLNPVLVVPCLWTPWGVWNHKIVHIKSCSILKIRKICCHLTLRNFWRYFSRSKGNIGTCIPRRTFALMRWLVIQLPTRVLVTVPISFADHHATCSLILRDPSIPDGSVYSMSFYVEG